MIMIGLVIGAGVCLAILLPKLARQSRSHHEALQELARQQACIEPLQKTLDKREAELRQTQVQLVESRTEVAELSTRLEEQNKRLQAQVKEFEGLRQQMKAEFENLSNRMLEEKGRKITEMNQSALFGLLNPLKEQMNEFRRRVDEVHHKSTQDQSSLRELMGRLESQYQKMSDETLNLTRALKGDHKLQGNWGEMILERVLEQSGLRKGREYETQCSLRDENQQRYQPDVVVHLPEGRDIIIDSKVSLNAFREAMAQSDQPESRQQSMKQLVRDIRQHILGLSEKDYSQLLGINTVDYVLMFMPIEAAFMAAFENDPDLFAEAFEKNIIVVTPTTLLAVLRTIDNIWRYERQNEHAVRIADSAAKIYDKLRLFVEDFQKIGQQMDATHKTYDQALRRLSEGRGNLLRQVDNFRELGVRVKKKLPVEFSETSE